MQFNPREYRWSAARNAGGVKALVQLAAAGPGDRAFGGAARALAVLLQPPSPPEARGLVFEAGGTGALVALLQKDYSVPQSGDWSLA